jgi:hypothetical protein
MAEIAQAWEMKLSCFNMTESLSISRDDGIMEAKD